MDGGEFVLPLAELGLEPSDLGLVAALLVGELVAQRRDDGVVPPGDGRGLGGDDPRLAAMVVDLLKQVGVLVDGLAADPGEAGDGVDVDVLVAAAQLADRLLDRGAGVVGALLGVPSQALDGGFGSGYRAGSCGGSWREPWDGSCWRLVASRSDSWAPRVWICSSGSRLAVPASPAAVQAPTPSSGCPESLVMIASMRAASVCQEVRWVAAGGALGRRRPVGPLLPRGAER